MERFERRGFYGWTDDLMELTDTLYPLNPHKSPEDVATGINILREISKRAQLLTIELLKLQAQTTE